MVIVQSYHYRLKGLEHSVFGWKVIIYKHNLDMSLSEEM